MVLHNICSWKNKFNVQNFLCMKQPWNINNYAYSMYCPKNVQNLYRSLVGQRRMDEAGLSTSSITLPYLTLSTNLVNLSYSIYPSCKPHLLTNLPTYGLLMHLSYPCLQIFLGRKNRHELWDMKLIKMYQSQTSLLTRIFETFVT